MTTIQSGKKALITFIGVLGLLLAAPGTAEAQSKADLAKIALGNSEYGKAIGLFKEALQDDDDDVALLVGAGDAYMALEKYDSARIMYERAYREESKDGKINIRLGTALSMLERHEEAIEKLRRGYKYDDESLESRLALADAYLRMGNDSLSKAEIAILGAKKEFPEDPRVYVSLGDLYFQQGVYELSESNYLKGIELDPTLIEPRIRLAVSYRSLGRRGGTAETTSNEYYEKAFDLFNEVTDMAPFEPIPWRNLGEILLLLKKYPQAVAAFQKYKELRPGDADADLLIGITASEAGAWSYTLEPARAILAANDERSKMFHGDARAWIARGNYKLGNDAEETNPDSARIYYTRSLEAYKMAPDSLIGPQDLLFMGNAHFEIGDTAAGVQTWVGILDRFPDSCDLAFRLAGSLYSKDLYAETIRAIDRIEAQCGMVDERMPMMRALSYVNMKDGDRGLDAMKQVIATDSANVKAWFWVTRLLVQEDRDAEILPLVPAIEKHLAVPDGATPEPELAWVWYFVGVAQYNADELKKAINAFEAAKEIKPDHTQAYLYLAVVYHKLKDVENACTNYRKVLQLDATNETAKKNLKALGC